MVGKYGGNFFCVLIILIRDFTRINVGIHTISISKFVPTTCIEQTPLLRISSSYDH